MFPNRYDAYLCFLGNYFLVEDVKKKGTSFIVIGTGHGVKSQTEMTAAEIIWLSRHRELETTFKPTTKNVIRNTYSVKVVKEALK